MDDTYTTKAQTVKKKLLYLLLLSLPAASWGVAPKKAKVQFTQPKTLLECLGQEEAKLHFSKVGGAIFRLNQRLVDYFSQEQTLSIRPEYLKEICRYQKFGPSIHFLEKAVLLERQLFTIQNEDERMRFEEFYRELPGIFIQYMSDLQVSMPIADCLSNQIKELKSFFYEYRYLESNLKIEYFFRNKKNLQSIFKKLQNLDAIYQHCEEEKNKQKSKKKK